MIQKRLLSGSETLVRQETAEGPSTDLSTDRILKPIDAFAGSPCVGCFFFCAMPILQPAVMDHSHGVATS